MTEPNLPLSWWHGNAWSEDTFDLLYSEGSTATQESPVPSLESLRALLESRNEHKPDSTFCFRLVASIVFGRKVEEWELLDPGFARTVFKRMDLELRPNLKEFMSVASWHLLAYSTYANLLDFDAESTNTSRIAHLSNRLLNPELLSRAWKQQKAKMAQRDVDLLVLEALAENPALPPETAEGLFRAVAETLFPPGRLSSDPYFDERDWHRLTSVLLSAISNPALPRGVFEDYINVLHALLPVERPWSGKDAGWLSRRPQVIMPWYASLEEVEARWKVVFGNNYPWGGNNPTLTRYERLNLSRVRCLGELTETMGLSQSPGSRKKNQRISERHLTQKLEGLLSGHKQGTRFVEVKDGKYDDQTWLLIYEFVTSAPNSYFLSAIKKSLMSGVTEGETTPDWLRFLIGSSLREETELRTSWLQFHGGSVAYAKRLGFGDVPLEWVQEVLMPRSKKE